MGILGNGADPDTGNATGIVMNSLPQNVRNVYAVQVDFWRAQVTNLSNLYAKLTESTLDEYDLSSGDGRTKGKRKDLSKVGEELNAAMNRLRFYEQKLYGRGITTIRLRRK